MILMLRILPGGFITSLNSLLLPIWSTILGGNALAQLWLQWIKLAFLLPSEPSSSLAAKLCSGLSAHLSCSYDFDLVEVRENISCDFLASGLESSAASLGDVFNEWETQR